MTGGTRKRGKTWSYYFDLGTVNGKRQKKEKGGFKTKKEAETALAKAITEYTTAGAVFEPSEITVSDYLNQWYESYCVLNLKPNTTKNYRRLIDKIIIPVIGKYKLCALNPAAVQRFIDGLKKDGYSKATVTLNRDILSSALNYAVHPLGYIQYNPCKQIKLPKFESKKEEKRFIITPENFQRIIEKFPSGHPYHIAFMIGYYNGLRLNEVFALTWDDIDLERRTISVNKAVVRFNKKGMDDHFVWHFTEPKSETSKRIVDFGNTLYTALKAARKQKQLNRLKYGLAFIESYYDSYQTTEGNNIIRLVYYSRETSCVLPVADMVCVQADGSYIGSDTVQSVSRRAIRDGLGIPFNFHSLRHTHATYLIESGVSVKAVQERLGHANVSVTMDRYVHNTDKAKKEAVDLFEKLVKTS